MSFTPQRKRGPSALPLKQRLLHHINKRGPLPPAETMVSGRCWIWTGSKTESRYGLVAVGRTQGGFSARLAHRVSYEVFVGPIPAGLEIDHLCLNRLCVRPTHLEPVTKSENLRRRSALNWRQPRQGGGGCVPDPSPKLAAASFSKKQIATKIQEILGDRYCPMRCLDLRGRWVHCIKEPGHEGPHILLSEPPMVAEVMLNNGVWIEKKRQVVRPLDGDWQNADPNNWEIVPRSQYMREYLASTRNRERRGDTYNELGGIWERECKRCGEYLPLERFAPNRHTCRECYRIRDRQRAKSRYHDDAVILSRQTYSLGTPGSPITPEQREAATFLVAAMLDAQAGDYFQARRKYWCRISSLLE